MVRNVEVATLILTLVPSSSFNRIVRKLGRDRLLVLLLAWLTLQPVITPLFVKSHLRAISNPSNFRVKLLLYTKNTYKTLN